MIVTVLGGSACSTPWLVEWLGQQRLQAEVTIRLAGRTLYRLAAVARACSLLAEGSLVRIEKYEAGEWESALSDADLVLIQVRVGGLGARHFDETFPQRYGIPGDEGLGPGGLAAAVRTWPELRELLDLIFTHAPRSLPILLTSPGNLLIRAAAREFPGRLLYGICELPFTTLERLCASCDAKVREVSVPIGDGGNPSPLGEARLGVTWSRATLPAGRAHEERLQGSSGVDPEIPESGVEWRSSSWCA